MASYCRFTVGSEQTSVKNIRYISRKEAVLEGELGALFHNFGPAVTVAPTYRELRSNLEAFAWSRERSEKARQSAKGGAGITRSHYRCVLSFEREKETPAIKRMVRDWLQTTFPLGVAAAFIHRNTGHVHVHVWLDARGTDGKKLDFSAKQWRQIGAKWDRIYDREIRRVELLAKRMSEMTVGERDGQQGRALRTSSGIPTRAKDVSPAPTRPTPGEQAANECLKSRKEAVRRIEQLRDSIEKLGQRANLRADRELDR